MTVPSQSVYCYGVAGRKEAVMVADNWLELASALTVLFTITAALLYAVLSARPGTPPERESAILTILVEVAADLGEIFPSES